VYTKLIWTGGADMDANNELLQAIGQMMDTKLAAALEPIRADIAELKAGQLVIQEDIEIIKEESTITRSMTNRLLKWAEKADRTAVNVGFDEEE